MGNKILSGGGRGRGGFSAPASADTDYRAKVSVADTTADVLNSKLAAGSNISSLTVLNPGGNEQLQINAATQAGDRKIMVSGADTTPAYAESKILAGSRITVTKENAGANEDLKIAADVQTGDGKILVSNADTTRNYAENKILAGSHIIITKENPGADEDLKIKVSTVTDWLDCKNWSFGSSNQWERQQKNIGQWWKDTCAFTANDVGYFDYAFPDTWDRADPYLSFYAMSDCPGTPTSIRVQSAGFVMADGDNLNTITYPAVVNMDRTYNFQYEFQIFPETAIPLNPAAGARAGKTYVSFKVIYSQTGTCSTLHLIGARIRYGLV